MVKKKTMTIDITPTWKTAAQVWIRVIEQGTPEGKVAARRGFLDMANKLDKVVELRKKGKLKELG